MRGHYPTSDPDVVLFPVTVRHVDPATLPAADLPCPVAGGMLTPWTACGSAGGRAHGCPGAACAVAARALRAVRVTERVCRRCHRPSATKWCASCADQAAAFGRAA